MPDAHNKKQKRDQDRNWEMQLNRPSAPSSRMVSPVRRMELPPALHELCRVGSGRGNVTSSSFLLPLVSTTFTSTTAKHTAHDASLVNSIYSPPQ